MIWQPFFSPSSILFGVGVLMVLAIVAYARSFRGRPLLSVFMLAMRVLLLAAVACVLMGPSILPPARTAPSRPKVIVMLDTSASMQTVDEAGQSRFAFATERWLNPSWLGRLRRMHDVTLMGFDEDPRPISDVWLMRDASRAATAGSSRIAACVHEIVSSISPSNASDQAAVMLVISDGHDTLSESIQSAALLAKAKTIPVFTLAVGGPFIQRDVAVLAVPMQEYLLVGEEGHLAVTVVQTGSEYMSATLHLKGEKSKTTHTVSLDGQRSVTLELPIKHDEAGVFEYEVSVEELGGEVETGNNIQSVFVEVTDRRIKVLILEGQPFWDTKFLAQSLRKDERIELAQVTQMLLRKTTTIVTRGDAHENRIPGSLDEMAQYDVIVLGRGLEFLMEPETVALLAAYVSSRAGRVVFARGRAYDPATVAGRRVGRELAVLEPVVWGRGLLRGRGIALDHAGRIHPSFALGDDRVDVSRVVAQLPALALLPVVSRAKASATVLARAVREHDAAEGVSTSGPVAAGQPVMLMMEYDRGMVVMIAGEGLWRWSLLPDDLQQLAGVYDRFWSNMIRWLVMGSAFKPGEEISLRLSHRSLRTEDPLTIDIVRRYPVEPDGDTETGLLSVIDPAGTRHELATTPVGDGRLRRRCEFVPRLPGVHQVRLERDAALMPIQVKFSSYAVDMERLHCDANVGLLRTLAEGSGGAVLDQDDPEQFFDVLERHRASMTVPPRAAYAWDRAWLLSVLLIWVGIEWLIRKKGGLP